uniref:Dynamin_N domain-containing protein n=1 Tax=Parastrongyloides trichosuri TaxID=131310 RepID=A0A0N4ZYV6_PARTI
MCGGGKHKPSAAHRRGKTTHENSKPKIPISRPKSPNVASKKKKKSSPKKQEVINLNINPLVIGALKTVPIFYQKSVMPFEKMYPINLVTKSLPWTDTEITGRPTIIVVGCAGTGKTALINFFLESDYKGSACSKETDKITVIQHGPEGAEILNKHTCKESNFQFKQIHSISDEMDDKVSIVFSQANCLKYVNLIDTPGYRASEFTKDNNELYDKVYQYLFERVEGIIVTFDQSKVGESSRELLKLLQKHMHKTVFVLNKCEEAQKTEELIKVREKLLWFLSNEIKADKPPQILFGSYRKTPVEMTSISELYLKDMDEINENIKKIYVQNVVSRLESIQDHCVTVYAWSTFFSALGEVMKKQYYDEKCTSLHQIETTIKLAFKSMARNEIVSKKLSDVEQILSEKYHMIDKIIKPCDIESLKELQELIEIHFVNIMNAGKDETEKKFKTSDFVLPQRKVVEKKGPEDSKKENKDKDTKETQPTKESKDINDDVKKLEAEKKILEMEKKTREDELRLKNEVEMKKKEGEDLKKKLEEEIREKLELEMQKKLEQEKVKKLEDEKRLADQEKIRKLEEEKLRRELEDKEKALKEQKKVENKAPVIVVVKGNERDKHAVSTRSTRSETDRSRGRSDKDKGGFKITLV